MTYQDVRYELDGEGILTLTLGPRPRADASLAITPTRAVSSTTNAILRNGARTILTLFTVEFAGAYIDITLSPSIVRLSGPVCAWRRPAVRTRSAR